MRKLLLLALLTLTVGLAQAQDAFKFRTTSVSFKYPDDRDFRKAEPCEVLVVVNFASERIHIFSKEKQTLDITRIGDTQRDKDGDEYFNMEAVDQDGMICRLTFMNIDSVEKGLKQLYLRYSNMTYVYNMWHAN